MIDLVYKIVQTVLNKDNQGYVSPEEFNLLLYQVIMEIFRNYFEDENRDKTRYQMNKVGKGYSNLAFNQRQMITQFSEFITLSAPSSNNNWSTFTLPDDLYFIEDNGVSSISGKVIEEVQRNSVIRTLNTEVAPTETYPVYEDYGDIVWVYPDTLETINLRYIRKPKQPNWTYVVVSGSELFNPAAPDFQDIELHESELSNIVIRLVSYFGINLREPEVMQISDKLMNNQNLKDNA